MKASVKYTINLEPLLIPPTVRGSDQNGDPVCIPLNHLDGNTLDRLCEDFRAGVFNHARVEQPPAAMAPYAPRQPMTEVQIDVSIRTVCSVIASQRKLIEVVRAVEKFHGIGGGA